MTDTERIVTVAVMIANREHVSDQIALDKAWQWWYRKYPEKRPLGYKRVSFCKPKVDRSSIEYALAIINSHQPSINEVARL